MPVVETRSVFSGIRVAEAMQRQVVCLSAGDPIEKGIRKMIRHKVNAVLLTDDAGIPCGVVTKTDVMGAFYVELPLETPLQAIMGCQPIACFPDDSIEDALEIMEAAGIHQVYITGADRASVEGVVSYVEIVGLLYRYCRSCERGTAKKREKRSSIYDSASYRAQEVMTRDVQGCLESVPLFEVIDALSAQHFGAVLIQNLSGNPVGVISKTDLMMAYHHGISPATEARNIMTQPVFSVSADDYLTSAIQKMLVWDVQRLFVTESDASSAPVIGVLALSDSARFRSGSCRACSASRMLIR